MLQMVRTETTCRNEEEKKKTQHIPTTIISKQTTVSQPSIMYSSKPTISSSTTNHPIHLHSSSSSHKEQTIPSSSSQLLLHHDEENGNESVTTYPTTHGRHHHHHHQQHLLSFQQLLLRTFQHYTLRTVAIEVSLYINIAILIIKLIVYLQTLSLSVLAALIDSALDVVSQFILNYTEKRSSIHRSSALYPAGASRLEPLGVLICAALMGMASFEVLKESIQNLYVEGTLRYTLTHTSSSSSSSSSSYNNNETLVVMTNNTQEQLLDSMIHEEMDRLSHFTASFWGMIGIIIIKYGLWYLCKHAARYSSSSRNTTSSSSSLDNTSTTTTTALLDPTLDALAQDHKNDCLSNIVASIALLSMLLSQDTLWYLDPLGALIISVYIIHSWYETAKEQIEQLTGKCAPVEFIDELYTIANTFDPRIVLVDVVRAYHFGPKFLVELEVVLPKDTPLIDSHDLGMDLQYEIESRPQVERCFVHIDYEAREYDEHVVSKVPELMARYRPSRKVAYLSADSSSFSSDALQIDEDDDRKEDDEKAKLDGKSKCYGSTKIHHIM